MVSNSSGEMIWTVGLMRSTDEMDCCKISYDYVGPIAAVERAPKPMTSSS